MTVEELLASPKYKYHHWALARGYESCKGRGRVEEYEGRFGRGYIWHSHYPHSSRYHRIEYYIEIDENGKESK